jgi:hypothetical protein
MPSVIIAASSSGDNQIVAAQPTKKIQIIAFYLVANGTVNAKWRSGTTDISGLLYEVANAGISVAAINPDGRRPWHETVAGQALNLNLSGAVAVGGQVYYELG